MQQRYVFALGVTLALLACSDSNGPDGQVHGPYVATRFLSIVEDDTFDIIDAGGFLKLDFDGSRFAGMLHMPKDEDSLDLTGAVLADGNRLRFKTSPVTILEQLEFTRDGADLVSDTTLNLVRFVITLEPEK